MSQALLLVLATIASIGGIPTSLTNNSASLPCHRLWLKAEALPVSLPLITNMPRSRALRTFNGTRRSCGHWRDAGAVILGKTVTTEMGGAFPGPTTNPFDPGAHRGVHPAARPR